MHVGRSVYKRHSRILTDALKTVIHMELLHGSDGRSMSTVDGIIEEVLDEADKLASYAKALGHFDDVVQTETMDVDRKLVETSDRALSLSSEAAACQSTEHMVREVRQKAILAYAIV